MIELAVIFITIGAGCFYAGVPYIVIFCISLFFGAGFCIYFPYRKTFIISAVLVVVCLIGAVLVSLRVSVTPKEVFGTREFIAEVVSLERELISTKIVVRDTVYKEHIQITLYEQSEVLPGDTVKIFGTIEQPEDFITDTGRLFEYREYLKSKDIVAVARNLDVVLVQQGVWSISRMTTIIRHKLADTISDIVSFPYDGIAVAMVFGYQGGISKEIEELFRTTGVLHTLVLSGYNITLLGGFLGIILQRIPQRLRIGITFMAIVSLIFISGAGVASIRAGMMGSIGLLSVLTLRQYSALRALTICFLIFFVWSPTSVFVDPGFHLSFLATFCMIAVVPKIEHLFYFIPKTPYINIRELVTLAVVLPVFIIPYTMYFSGLVPLAAFPANIVLGVVTPSIMILAPLVLVVSFISPLATIVGAVLAGVLGITIQILEFLDHLPQYNTPELSSWSVVGIYSASMFFLFRKELKEFIVRLRNSLLPQSNSFEQESQ